MNTSSREKIVRTHAGRSVRVLKFGGSSVGNSEGIRRVVDIIGRTTERHRVVVVVSALSSVTDTLEIMLSETTIDRTKLLLDLYRRHVETARDLLSLKVFNGYRIVLGEQLASVVPALRRLERRIHSRFDAEFVLAAGERFSVPLIAAALRDVGCRSLAVDGKALIHLDDDSRRTVDVERTETQIRAWFADVPDTCVPVVTGFIGSSRCGNTMTLGRGGSDLTAALLASSLRAQQMERWTDVDGLYDEDPKTNKKASRYRVLKMDEADELNCAIGLGMHRHTLQPLIAARVPLRVRSIHSSGSGTLVIPVR